MAGNARRKIDSYTQQMFDPEVDRPEHDQILTCLFAEEGTLARLLTEIHDLPLLDPLDDDASFEVRDQQARKTGQISMKEAHERTGKRPRWSSNLPVRIRHKQLEVLMNYSTDPEGRYERLVGFVDLGTWYEVMKWPRLTEEKGKLLWAYPAERFNACFEVKSAWPTAGNLLRQLNLYKSARPSGLGNFKRTNVVVGPDDSMNALVCEHGYRLVTFDATGKSFQLQPLVTPRTPVNDATTNV